MNRDAFLIYLKDLRDLEFARESLDTALARGKANYNGQVNFLNRTNYKQADSDLTFGHVLFNIIKVLIAAFGLVIVIPMTKRVTLFPESNFLFLGTIDAVVTYLIAGVLIIYIIAKIVMFILEISGSISDKKEVREHNQQEAIAEQNRKKQLVTLNASWNKESASLKRQYNQVDTLLKNGYNLNLIPSPYRNLASLYYIYDYMSTSQASFEDTLMHEHMENGIQRILSRLDTIIAQNEQIIFQNRQLEAQNRQMIERTDRMLASLQRTEQNTLAGAQYAKISAQHTQTIAVFKEMEFWDNYSKRR